MKITIVLDSGQRRAAKLPYANAPHIIAHMPCPNGCKLGDTFDGTGVGMPMPLKVAGTGIKHANRDTYFADAVALCCRKKIGTIETKVDTVFGIEEDERVLNGPWRVY